MASRYDEFLAGGVRLVAIDVDTPSQHAAMIAKLDLPFPYLSDPDRSKAIRPFDVADERDPRGIARPAMVLVDAKGEEALRFVSRDYADRSPEDDVLAVAAGMELRPTEAEPMNPGTPGPGVGAFPFEGLWYYLRGARFAAQAMGIRHKDAADSITEDAKAYVATMDRMIDAVKALTKRRDD